MTRSKAGWLASRPPEEIARFLDGLSGNALAALPWLWPVWAHPDHQLPPEGAAGGSDGDWHTWVILGGRGAGKTRAGAEWVRSRIEGATPLAGGTCRRFCLLGETIDEARGVMVEGESGLLAISPPDRRPVFKAERGRLEWPNGAEAMIASAANPEALRGPQFDGAWSDELAKWRRGREAWEMLQFCLRLGQDPRQVVTTTPRDNPVLKEIMGQPGVAITRAGTAVNRANLAPGFVERLKARHAGTALGRQEIEGELVEGREGALWTPAMIDAGRVGADAVPLLDRVVVAVDPPATSGPSADACGIVVAGLKRAEALEDWRVWVLEDASVAGRRPRDWARAAAEAYARHGADRIVAEVNQGGEMVEAVMRQVAPQAPFRAVRATRGKVLRAEPVAALYEQGRVHHAGAFAALEGEMCRYAGPGDPGGSPDRLDALVWAVTDLVLGPEAGMDAPRMRRL
ncbi:MAG: terminase family protein [Pseudomonadota bacterium]